MRLHRIDSSLQGTLGFFALGAMLLLVSPGVQIAQAADGDPAVAAAASVDPLLARRAVLPQAPSPAAAPSCENPGEPLLDDALLQRQLRDLVARAAAQQAVGAQSSEHGIVLNGRGYNYRPTPVRPPGS